MANQIIVTNTGNVQVALTPPPNVQVQISRAAIGTVSNVPSANFANYAANVTSSNQPNITNIGTLGNLSVSNTITTLNLNVTGNLSAGNLVANSANYANFANVANIANVANSVAVANVSGIGNIATVNLDGNSSNVLYGNGVFATISIPAGDQISNGTSNVSIPVANSNVEIYANNQHWTFANTGNLLLAGGNGVVQSIANSSLDPINPNVSTMVLTPDQGYTSQALVLDPTTPGHIHLRAPGSNIDQPQANVYLGGEASSFEVGVFNGAVPNLFIHSNNKTWMFDIDGNLTLPANTFAINYANGIQVPLDGPVANANYANFAGTVVNATQSNITSLGTLTGLNVTGNANINGTLIMSATTTNQVDISGVDNGSNATQRGLTINAGTTFSPNVVSGTGGGATTIRGGNAWGNTDTGAVWNATSGAMQFSAGSAFTANGNATGGQATLGAGTATTNKTGRAVGGQLIISSGGATANANTANSGNLTIGTGFAASNGVARSGTISMQIGNANGVTGNTYGNIDIGTLNTPDFYSAPTSINIGQANTPTVIGGNVSALNANLGNLATANFFSGDGSLLSNINGSNVSNVANANYANFAGQVVDATQSNITTLGTLTNVSVAGNVFAPAIVQNASSYDTRVSLSSAAGIVEITSAGNSTKFGPSGTVELGGAAQVIGGTFGGSGITLGASQTDIFQNRSGNVTVQVGNSGTISSIWNFNNDGNLVLPANAFAVKYANGTQVNLDGPVANANYANFAGTAYSVSGSNVSGEVANANYSTYSGTAGTANSVDGANVSGQVANALIAGTVYTNAQPNITSVGTLAGLSVTGNATFGNSIIMGGTTPNQPDISGTNNGSNAAQRQLLIFGGSTDSPNVASGTQSGGISIVSGSASYNTDTGTQWNANTGTITLSGGTAASANGNATTNTITLSAGLAQTLLTGRAVGGNVQLISGGAVANNNTANSGGITIRTGQAVSNTVARTGNIDIQIGNANGVTGNTIGNINIGSSSTGLYSAPTRINIGGTTTTTVINSNSLTVGDGNGIITTSRVNLNGQPGGAIATTIDNVVNCPDIAFNRYDNNAYINNYSVYRARGTSASPTDVVAGDVLFQIYNSAYSNSSAPYTPTGTFSSTVNTNDNAGNITINTSYSASIPTGSTFTIGYGQLNVQGSANIGTGGTGDLNVNGNISYTTRTFGNFTSNVTQTNSNVGNAIYMTLNNDEGSNGVSIVSNSQITTSRTGNYNIQFSAQVEKTDSGTDEVEIWLNKNGSPVANSATRLAQQGNNEKGVAAWNWLVNSANVNDYYQIAWASTDANMRITAIDSANTLSGVAIPSLIVTVVPVGA